MASEPLVAAALVRRFVDVLTERGVDRAALLASAAISPDQMRLLRLRLPWSMVEDLVEAAERLSGDDRLGFHLVHDHDLETLALPGYLFFASRTLGDAMGRLVGALRLWSDAYRVRADAESSAYVLELLRPERRACAHVREQSLAMLTGVIRHAIGASICPVEVRFEHTRTGDIGEYEDYFGCPVRFGAAKTEIRLSPEQLRLPLTTASPFYLPYLERQARDELAKLPQGQTVRGRVSAALEEDYEAYRLGESTLEGVAERLRSSPRTLQRLLGGEGTSFAAELAGVRRKHAEALLLDGVDIGEVSWRLGYAEPAVFHRAFKRWTGQTPEEHRRQRAQRG